MPARVFQHGVPPQRLRTFLILFALALTLPLLGLAIFALNRMASLEQAEIERRVLQIAEDLADDIDRELDRAVVTLETLATSTALARRDFAAFHEQAGRALRRDKAGILLIDRAYQQVLNTRAPFGQPLPKTADIPTAQRVFETKERQISDLFVGYVSGQHVINVEVPVIEDDDVHYALTMALNATRFENLLQGQRLEPHWITGITDRKGIILARSERHAEFVGKPLPAELFKRSLAAKGVFRATSVAGEQILRATVPSRVTGWLVSATVPVSYLEAPRRRGMLFASAMIATALMLGGALAYIFGSFMARPLAAAAHAAEAIGAAKPVESLHSPLVEANTVTAALSTAALELKRRQEHAEFLMQELAHRAKNQLAVVKGMALQTARQSRSVEQFTDHFGQRIQGLAESQDLMLQQNWQGAWLSDLVRAQLELFAAGNRAEIKGPPIFLNANAVQNIGFALHELATNASKHGALSSPQGRVSVIWSGPTPGGRIHLEWTEQGGPPVHPPERKGFGHLVITDLVAQALQGTSNLEFRAEGVVWSLDIPATHAPSAATTTEAPP
jgi:two-component sensor histidine kinase